MAFYSVKTWTNAADFNTWSNGRVPLSTNLLALLFAAFNDLTAAKVQAHWRLTDGADITARLQDISSNNLDLSPVNSPAVVTNGVSINGINQYLTRAFDATLGMTGRDVTWRFLFKNWIDPGAVTVTLIHESDNLATGRRILFHDLSEIIRSTLGGSTISMINDFQGDTVWNLAEVSYNGTAGTPIYRMKMLREDGTAENKEVTNTYEPNNGNFFIGANKTGTSAFFTAILSQIWVVNEYSTANLSSTVFDVGAAHSDGLWPYPDALHAPGGDIRVTATFTEPNSDSVAVRVRRLPLAGSVDPDSGPAWSAFNNLTSTTAAIITPPTRGNFVQIQLKLTPDTDPLKTTSPEISDIVLESNAAVGGPLILSGRDQHLDQSLFV